LKFEVEDDALAPSNINGNAHSVCYPLSSRKEGLKSASECRLIGASAGTPTDRTEAVKLQNLGNGITPPCKAKLLLYVVTETQKAAVPGSIGCHNRIDVGLGEPECCALQW
jgi:hypothetical protein